MHAHSVWPRGFARLAVKLVAVLTIGSVEAAPLSPSSGAVEVFQLDVRRGPDSMLGRVTIVIAPAQAITGLPSGYVNVADFNGRWLVQNMPLFDPLQAGYGRCSVQIDLSLVSSAAPMANGTPVELAFLAVEYTPLPLTTWTPSFFDVFVVERADERIGGGDGGPLVGYRAGSLWESILDFFGLPGIQNEEVLQAGHPNVEAADDQCVPAAVANSLQFLENTTDVEIPHDNVPGTRLDDPNAESLVGELEKKMNRGVRSRYDGDSTSWYSMLTGKLDYLAMNDLDDEIEVKHQGRFPAQPQGTDGSQDYTSSGVTSTGKGAIPTYEHIMQELRDGEDVEMNLAYPNPNWDPNVPLDPSDPNTLPLKGGHAVEVIGAGKRAGEPYVRHISDSKQSDPNHPEYDDPTHEDSGTKDVDHDDWTTDPNEIPEQVKRYFPGFPYLKQSGAVVMSVISQSPKEPVPGDVDGDGDVDLDDLLLLLGVFGHPGPGSPGDADGDGDTDLDDLLAVLGNFGA